MYWLARPPYLRWLGAAAILTAAAYLEVSGPAAQPYPFAAAPAPRGETVSVVWRDVAPGSLPEPADLVGVARIDIPADTPLVAGLLAARRPIPADWWALPVELPAVAAPGAEVLVAARAPDLTVAGIVVFPGSDGGFGAPAPGLVAVPPEHAAAVAAALTERRATVLIRP